MSFVLLIGEGGRMSTALQEVLQSKSKSFKTLAEINHVPASLNLKQATGIVDFSSPEATAAVAKLAVENELPLVCGTTGWKPSNAVEAVFAEPAKKIPIVWDSNFSIGIEQLCQSAESMTRMKPLSIVIEDIHHIHKKDSPSGTALKIERRIKNISTSVPLTIDSKREGEVFGIHRVIFRFESESLEISHIASSRRIFAEGALKSLEWLTNQKPGLYSMRDVLKET